jgi:hypothetical protein
LWDWGGNRTRTADAYRFLQAGVGYDIADIGLIRAQFIGGWFGTINEDKLKDQGVKWNIEPSPGDTARIEAAFALTAIQNLTLDLGFKFWLPLTFEDVSKSSNGLEVGLGAQFRADAFQIIAQIHSKFASYSRSIAPGVDDKSANGLGLEVNLIPTYDLDAATLGASIGLKIGGKAKNGDGDAVDNSNTMQVGFGAFVQKGLGSGSVKAGLAYTLAETTGGKANGSGVFSIPIILEYAFF